MYIYTDSYVLIIVFIKQKFFCDYTQYCIYRKILYCMKTIMKTQQSPMTTNFILQLNITQRLQFYLPTTTTTTTTPTTNNTTTHYYLLLLCCCSTYTFANSIPCLQSATQRTFFSFKNIRLHLFPVLIPFSCLKFTIASIGSKSSQSQSSSTAQSALTRAYLLQYYQCQQYLHLCY